MKAKKTFNQLFSDIFNLKYKTPTILLGTFVPFFVAHVFAYAVSKARKQIMNKEPHYGLNLFAAIYSLVIIYGGGLVVLLLTLKDPIYYAPNILFISLSLIVFLAVNFTLTKLYHSFYKKQVLGNKI